MDRGGGFCGEIEGEAHFLLPEEQLVGPGY